MTEPMSGHGTRTIAWSSLLLLVATTMGAALLSGTTLGIMSLDLTYLRVMKSSGTRGQRRYAQAILRVRQYPNWLLCSLILVSALLNSWIPIIRNNALPHTRDFLSPNIISNLYGAFFIDMVGQLLVRQRSLKIAFRVMPLIFPIMGIMAIPSFLPSVAMKYWQKWFSAGAAEDGILSNNSLWTFIRHHEEDANFGGMLWEETSLYMRGALELQGKYARDAMTAWAHVKKIRLGESVTSEFVGRVKAWACSPIIVVANVQHTSNGEAPQRVMGYLHIRELLGVNERYDWPPFVKNLDLRPIVMIPEDYPLPYLLKLFLGKPRDSIAIVVHSHRKKLGPNQAMTSSYRAILAREVERTDELLGYMKNRHPRERRRPALTDAPYREPLGIITAIDVTRMLVTLSAESA
ncbi:MAG: hypothetical protein M1835_004983 [Candelina submexicana]|nr:MAG: hypothetical protein M1835_004983 [Candelina submexicana]